jgi:ABC-2 type transport system permease protein
VMTTQTPTTSRESACTDSMTMLRRNLLRLRRYPGLTGFLILGPVVILVLFVYVFGGTLGAGLGEGAAPGADARTAYLAYVTPTILVFTVVGIAQGIAISVAMDMTQGVVARFRTMPISRGSVLAGHVLSYLVLGVVALALLLGVAVLMGYRPGASGPDWLALAGLLLLFLVGMMWLTTGMGLAATTVEEASNTPQIFMLLPFLGSGFVPVDSMPTAVRWFAEHQPFTPVIESVRGLLQGSVDATSWWLALGWSALFLVGGWAWARSQYAKERTR